MESIRRGKFLPLTTAAPKSSELADGGIEGPIGSLGEFEGAGGKSEKVGAAWPGFWGGGGEAVDLRVGFVIGKDGIESRDAIESGEDCGFGVGVAIFRGVECDVEGRAHAGRAEAVAAEVLRGFGFRRKKALPDTEQGQKAKRELTHGRRHCSRQRAFPQR